MSDCDHLDGAAAVDCERTCRGSNGLGEPLYDEVADCVDEVCSPICDS
jgi:hypothetical protein